MGTPDQAPRRGSDLAFKCAQQLRPASRASAWKLCLEKSQKGTFQVLWQLKSQKGGKERKGAIHFFSTLLFFIILKLGCN